MLKLDAVSKRFGDSLVVDGLSLEVGEGEFFTLLGSSGCGKTTTLRMIAGLEEPDDGTISLRGRVLAEPRTRTHVPAQRRNLGLVFQSYAIWPHLDVAGNVAYPLRVRRVKPAEIATRVKRVLDLVGLAGFEKRPATTLSGGQQQRVALARALVYEPDLLLLDEPFSNLDVKLREQLRVELKLLQKRIGVTVIFVTHDREEALSLSDRIAVMEAGRIAQLGPPRTLYEQPVTPFVRDFLGQSNQLDGVVAEILGGGQARVTLAGGAVLTGTMASGVASGQNVTLGIRPEDVGIRKHDGICAADEIEGVVETFLFLGDRAACYVRALDRAIMLHVPRGADFHARDRVILRLPAGSVTLWP